MGGRNTIELGGLAVYASHTAEFLIELDVELLGRECGRDEQIDGRWVQRQRCVEAVRSARRTTQIPIAPIEAPEDKYHRQKPYRRVL